MATHSMTRRAVAHDYTKTGIYHITLHVADGLWQPLGDVVGDAMAPDGMPDAPRVDMTPIGQMVEYELLHSIHEHYPMVIVDTYIIMPDHLHFILEVHDKIISRNGKLLPLGQVIAGFKKGCNKRYWEMTGNAGGVTAAHTMGNSAAPSVPCGFPVSSSVPSGFLAGSKPPSNATTGRQSLFALGYCDVMPVDAAQLASQRAYIKGNPRSRLQRMNNRSLLSVCRSAINTALTLSALRGFLKRECMAKHATPDALLAIECRLLLVSPWGYQYRGKNEQVTIPFCKAMNCVAQALCRTKDDWWKDIALK